MSDQAQSISRNIIAINKRMLAIKSGNPNNPLKSNAPNSSNAIRLGFSERDASKCNHFGNPRTVHRTASKCCRFSECKTLECSPTYPSNTHTHTHTPYDPIYLHCRFVRQTLAMRAANKARSPRTSNSIAGVAILPPKTHALTPRADILHTFCLSSPLTKRNHPPHPSNWHMCE